MSARFGYRREPSKAELREMLAEAIRNTEAKKLAATVSAPEPAPVPLPIPEPIANPIVAAAEPEVPETIWHSVYGRETRPQWERRLEETRKFQERVWFVCGWTREEVVEAFKNWPYEKTYPRYDFVVGFPDDPIPPADKWRLEKIRIRSLRRREGRERSYFRHR